MTDRPRIGVLGLGSIGHRHLCNALAAGAEVVGFDPAITQDLQVDGRTVALSPNIEALIAGPLDGLVIASPSAQHAEQLRLAVEAGIGCLVEKPLATRSGDVETTLRRADADGVPVCAALNLRFHPAVTAAADHLKQGAIGTPTHAQFVFSDWMPGWRPNRDYRALYAAHPETGGVLFDHIHEFDLAVSLLGAAEVVACVAGRSGALDMASEDRADVILAHASGAQSALHLDYCSRGRRRNFTLAGDLGRLSVDLDARRLTIETVDLPPETRQFEGGYADDYRREMDDFLATLRGDRPRCDGWEALAVVNVVLRARDLAGLAAHRGEGK